jgi:hypothetical protein
MGMISSYLFVLSGSDRFNQALRRMKACFASLSIALPIIACRSAIKGHAVRVGSYLTLHPALHRPVLWRIGVEFREGLLPEGASFLYIAPSFVEEAHVR